MSTVTATESSPVESQRIDSSAGRNGAGAKKRGKRSRRRAIRRRSSGKSSGIERTAAAAYAAIEKEEGGLGDAPFGDDVRVKPRYAPPDHGSNRLGHGTKNGISDDFNSNSSHDRNENFNSSCGSGHLSDELENNNHLNGDGDFNSSYNTCCSGIGGNNNFNGSDNKFNGSENNLNGSDNTLFGSDNTFDGSYTSCYSKDENFNDSNGFNSHGSGYNSVGGALYTIVEDPYSDYSGQSETEKKLRREGAEGFNESHSFNAGCDPSWWRKSEERLDLLLQELEPMAYDKSENRLNQKSNEKELVERLGGDEQLVPTTRSQRSEEVLKSCMRLEQTQQQPHQEQQQPPYDIVVAGDIDGHRESPQDSFDWDNQQSKSKTKNAVTKIGQKIIKSEKQKQSTWGRILQHSKKIESDKNKKEDEDCGKRKGDKRGNRRKSDAGRGSSSKTSGSSNRCKPPSMISVTFDDNASDCTLESEISNVSDEKFGFFAPLPPRLASMWNNNAEDLNASSRDFNRPSKFLPNAVKAKGIGPADEFNASTDDFFPEIPMDGASSSDSESEENSALPLNSRLAKMMEAKTLRQSQLQPFKMDSMKSLGLEQLENSSDDDGDNDLSKKDKQNKDSKGSMPTRGTLSKEKPYADEVARSSSDDSLPARRLLAKLESSRNLGLMSSSSSDSDSDDSNDPQPQRGFFAKRESSTLRQSQLKPFPDEVLNGRQHSGKGPNGRQSSEGSDSFPAKGLLAKIESSRTLGVMSSSSASDDDDDEGNDDDDPLSQRGQLTKMELTTLRESQLQPFLDEIPNGRQSSKRSDTLPARGLTSRLDSMKSMSLQHLEQSSDDDDDDDSLPARGLLAKMCSMRTLGVMSSSSSSMSSDDDNPLPQRGLRVRMESATLRESQLKPFPDEVLNARHGSEGSDSLPARALLAKIESSRSLGVMSSGSSSSSTSSSDHEDNPLPQRGLLTKMESTTLRESQLKPFPDEVLGCVDGDSLPAEKTKRAMIGTDANGQVQSAFPNEGSGSDDDSEASSTYDGSNPSNFTDETGSVEDQSGHDSNDEDDDDGDDKGDDDNDVPNNERLPKGSEFRTSLGSNPGELDKSNYSSGTSDRYYSSGASTSRMRNGRPLKKGVDGDMLSVLSDATGSDSDSGDDGNLDNRDDDAGTSTGDAWPSGSASSDAGCSDSTIDSDEEPPNFPREAGESLDEGGDEKSAQVKFQKKRVPPNGLVQRRGADEEDGARKVNADAANGKRRRRLSRRRRSERKKDSRGAEAGFAKTPSYSHRRKRSPKKRRSSRKLKAPDTTKDLGDGVNDDSGVVAEGQVDGGRLAKERPGLKTMLSGQNTRRMSGSGGGKIASPGETDTDSEGEEDNSAGEGDAKDGLCPGIGVFHPKRMLKCSRRSKVLDSTTAMEKATSSSREIEEAEGVDLSSEEGEEAEAAKQPGFRPKKMVSHWIMQRQASRRHKLAGEDSGEEDSDEGDDSEKDMDDKDACGEAGTAVTPFNGPMKTESTSQDDAEAIIAKYAHRPKKKYTDEENEVAKGGEISILPSSEENTKGKGNIETIDEAILSEEDLPTVEAILEEAAEEDSDDVKEPIGTTAPRKNGGIIQKEILNQSARWASVKMKKVLDVTAEKVASVTQALDETAERVASATADIAARPKSPAAQHHKPPRTQGKAARKASRKDEVAQERALNRREQKRGEREVDDGSGGRRRRRGGVPPVADRNLDVSIKTELSESIRTESSADTAAALERQRREVVDSRRGRQLRQQRRRQAAAPRRATPRRHPQRSPSPQRGCEWRRQQQRRDCHGGRMRNENFRGDVSATAECSRCSRVYDGSVSTGTSTLSSHDPFVRGEPPEQRHARVREHPHERTRCQQQQQRHDGQHSTDRGGRAGQGQPVSWDDLDYAIEAGIHRSLKEVNSRELTDYGRTPRASSRRHSWQQEGANYGARDGHRQGESTGLGAHGGEAGGQVSWDDLEDAIQVGIHGSLRDLTLKVVQKQEWKHSYDDVTGAGSDERPDIDDRPWSCPACTYHNEGGGLHCGVCDRPRCGHPRTLLPNEVPCAQRL